MTKEIKIKPIGALIKRFGEVVAERKECEEKLKNVIAVLVQKRNELLLHKAHNLRVEGFDLALGIVKKMFTSNEKIPHT